MKKLTTIILLAIALSGLIACKKGVTGAGPLVSQGRVITDFKTIELQMYGDVYYTNAPTRKLEIVAQQNILDILETVITDHKLGIRFKHGNDYRESDQIRINVSGPDVNNLVTTTAGSITVINGIYSDNVVLRVYGSGDIKLNSVHASTIDAINSGSGSIKSVTGSVLVENLKSSGSGDIDLARVESKDVKAIVSGSGDIKVRATDQLHATINGSGSIYFSGFPDVSSHVSGTGRLVRF